MVVANIEATDGGRLVAAGNARVLSARLSDAKFFWNEDLAAGFLLSEGLVTDRDALVSIDADAKRGLVWVTSTEAVPAEQADRRRYLTSGCGRGVTVQISTWPTPRAFQRGSRVAPLSKASPAASSMVCPIIV